MIVAHLLGMVDAAVYILPASSLFPASCGFQTQQSERGAKIEKESFGKKGETRLVLFQGVYRDIEMFEKWEFLRYFRYSR